ncbi:uncharacterized protein PAC_10222 [Phialocephala subalpina]|uniref:Uncharacterized protein n=1 Tax=Phialocephala subalpina TaxID=576137 RepID=A0A1L7X5L8_9HELO|nr:uncharacterized protein PAC_10222 [Phialocephala subalpina]
MFGSPVSALEDKSEKDLATFNKLSPKDSFLLNAVRETRDGTLCLSRVGSQLKAGAHLCLRSQNLVSSHARSGTTSCSVTVRYQSTRRFSMKTALIDRIFKGAIITGASGIFEQVVELTAFASIESDRIRYLMLKTNRANFDQLLTPTSTMMPLFEGDFFSLARTHIRLARYEVFEGSSELDILTRKLTAISSTHFIDALATLINSSHTPSLAVEALRKCRPTFRLLKRQIEESFPLNPSDLNWCWGMLKTACDLLDPRQISSQHGTDSALPLRPDEKAPGEVHQDVDDQGDDAETEGDVAEKGGEDGEEMMSAEENKGRAQEINSVLRNAIEEIGLDDGNAVGRECVQQLIEHGTVNEQGESIDEEAE